MGQLQNYINKKKSLRESWAFEASHPLVVRKHQLGGILKGVGSIPGRSIRSLGRAANKSLPMSERAAHGVMGALGIGATGAAGYGAYAAYTAGKALAEGVPQDTGDVRIRIDDDNSWWVGSGNPVLQIEFAKGMGTDLISGGDFIGIGQTYSFPLVSPQPAYMLRKALGLRSTTAADNVSYSVDPSQLASVLASMGTGIYEDAKDGMIVEMEVIPKLEAQAEMLASEGEFGEIYEVQRGDTLAIIADKVGTSIENIINANPDLQGEDVELEPGMIIELGEDAGIPGDSEDEFEGEFEDEAETGLGSAAADLRGKYVDFNTRRLSKKAGRNESRAENLRAKAKSASNPRRKRRLSNRATRAEARSNKADYKSKNLR